jgi:hypothetical protein
MNAYLFLTQKNVRINDIPPRLMWNIDDNNWSSSASGYCGETSILSAGLLYGQYIPMYMVRQVLADYFNTLWGDSPTTPSAALQQMWSSYFGAGWNDSGSPGGDFPGDKDGFQKWFEKNGQYYCQVLPQIWDNSKGGDNSSFVPINAVLKNLHLAYEHFEGKDQDTKKNFIPWMKQHVVNGRPVVLGVQDFLAGSNDTDFDHIVIVIGWGSNNDFSNPEYFADDEIVFSDHGLVVCGQQPHGGAIPYYFRFIMETQDSIAATGGWLPDGGCPDPENPAWNFIMDLGQYRNLNEQDVPCSDGKYTCNAYQLAQSPSARGSNGNAAFAITGLSDTLPQGVTVRIDTDRYFVVPCITTHQAKAGVQPVCTQTMNHKITISGLNTGTNYNVWLFTAKNTGELSQIPDSGFNAYGKKTGAVCYTISGQSSAAYNYTLPADVALLVRCVEADK